MKSNASGLQTSFTAQIQPMTATLSLQFLGGYAAEIHSTAAPSVTHCTTAEAESGVSGLSILVDKFSP